jgi:hypothetical protein
LATSFILDAASVSFFGASALSIARFGDGGDDRRNGGDPVVVVNAAMTRR